MIAVYQNQHTVQYKASRGLMDFRSARKNTLKPKFLLEASRLRIERMLKIPGPSPFL